MLRTFSGFAAFILTFGCSVSLVGLLFGFPQAGTSAFELGRSTSGKQAIRSLLVRDVRYGRERARKIRFRVYGQNSSDDRFYEYRSIVREYLAKSTSIDQSGLPEDFRYAWEQHMNAWRDEMDLLTRAGSSNFANRDMSKEEFRAEYDRKGRKINETWYQVLRIARRYGVNTRGF